MVGTGLSYCRIGITRCRPAVRRVSVPCFVFQDSRTDTRRPPSPPIGTPPPPPPPPLLHRLPPLALVCVHRKIHSPFMAGFGLSYRGVRVCRAEFLRRNNRLVGKCGAWAATLAGRRRLQDLYGYVSLRLSPNHSPTPLFTSYRENTEMAAQSDPYHPSLDCVGVIFDSPLVGPCLAPGNGIERRVSMDSGAR